MKVVITPDIIAASVNGHGATMRALREIMQGIADDIRKPLTRADQPATPQEPTPVPE